MTHDLDNTIRDALRSNDAALLKELGGETSLPELLMDNFKGTFRLLNIGGILVALAMMALAIYCAIRYFRAESVRELLAWAVGFCFCMLALLAIKIWFWLELNKHAVTREIKRVELQLARLAAKMDGDG